MRELSKDKSSYNERKARTRTLIQLGGLVEKMKLTEIFGIELGDDLQDHGDNWDKAASLVGFLEHAKLALLADIDLPSEDLALWSKTGNRILRG